MAPEHILAGVMAAALVLYALLGGADFGGGVWDLFAAGKRKLAQRDLIERAIGPVWEANHVWLIFVVVLLFSAFPTAFRVLSIALHVPLTVFLIGVVFRGAAFTFRTYDARRALAQRRWGLLFSGSSILAPLLLGACVAALASGQISVRDGAVEVQGLPYATPFAAVVGLFALGLFAYLAAVYLTCEAESPELAEDFRLRAFVSHGAVGGTGARRIPALR